MFRQRLCMIQSHGKRPLQILCVEDNCKKNRLCCSLCYFRDHQRHQAIHMVEKSNNSRLECFKIHADNPQSKGFEYFTKLLQDINQVYEQTIEQTNNNFRNCYKRIKEQYLLIANIFTKDLHNKVLDQLIDTSKQQHYVNMLKFLQKIPELGNAQELIQKGVNISHKVINTMKELKTQMNSILLKAQQDLSKISFSQQKNKFLEDEQTFAIVNSHEVDVKKKNNETSQVNHQFQKQPKKIIASKKIIRKHKRIQKQLSKYEKQFLIQQKKKQLTNKSNKVIIQSEQLLVNKTNGITSNRQDITLLNKKQLNQGLNIHLPKNEEIHTKLKIERNSANKSLQIYNDVGLNISQSQVLSIIRQEKGIQALRINWCHYFSPETIIIILQNLPKLKFINLGFCPIDEKIVDILVDRFPNIQQFNYGLDYEKDYYKFSIDYNFFNPEIYNPFENTNLRQIMELKKLKNIWISNCQADQTLQIVKKLKQVTKITFGKYAEQQILKSKLVMQLQLKTNLTTLVLQSLIIQQNGLKNVFHNNTYLYTIVISGCSGITKNTITAIRNSCQYLTTLHLYALSNIQGREIWQIKQLKNLTIINCPKIDGNGLKNLSNLQLLDISIYEQQSWVNDKLMEEIKQLNKLKALNIQDTFIIGKGILKLKNLKLEMLNCGRTSIKLKYLFELFQTNNSIKKLSLQGLNGQNQTEKITSEDVLKMFKLLPNLTHLNIGDCSIQIGANLMSKLEKLKCLTISYQNLTDKQQSQLLKAGVSVNFESQ